MLPDSRPEPRRLASFLLVVVMLDLAALVLVATVAPPDAFTTPYVAGLMFLVAPVIGYVLVYRFPTTAG